MDWVIWINLTCLQLTHISNFLLYTCKNFLENVKEHICTLLGDSPRLNGRFCRNIIFSYFLRLRLIPSRLKINYIWISFWIRILIDTWSLIVNCGIIILFLEWSPSLLASLCRWKINLDLNRSKLCFTLWTNRIIESPFHT